MKYRCRCGAVYVVVPKEIPWTESERLACIDCGYALSGPWSLRNFDFEPLQRPPMEDVPKS